MILSVSHLKDHMTCPQYAHNKHVLLRGIATESPALALGSLWHLGMAVRLGSTTKEADYATALKLAPTPTLDAFYPLTLALTAWKRPPEWEKVGFIERELRIQFGAHTLAGTVDAVVLWNGRYWHLQHKTLSPSVPLDVYAEQQSTDWHESAYQRMLQSAGYDTAGTILNIVRKLSQKSMVLDPKRALSLQYVTRSERVVTEAIDDMARLAIEISSQTVPIKNRAACAGPYRNHLCPYKPVCDGKCALSDPCYINLEPRYTEATDADS